MFPHTLSLRPIVINANSEIEIIISENVKQPALVHGDSRFCGEVGGGGRVYIRKNLQALRIIHPKIMIILRRCIQS